MKKLLLVAVLAITTSLSVFAQGGLQYPGWQNIRPSFSGQSETGTAYLFECPVSKDINGALSINYNILLNPYIQTEKGPEQISAKLEGNLPGNWLTFTDPAYGEWVTNPDGSQWFRYKRIVAISIGREKVPSGTLPRGINPHEPQYRDKWYTKYQLLL